MFSVPVISILCISGVVVLRITCLNLHRIHYDASIRSKVSKKINLPVDHFQCDLFLIFALQKSSGEFVFFGFKAMVMTTLFDVDGPDEVAKYEVISLANVYLTSRHLPQLYSTCCSGLWFALLCKSKNMQRKAREKQNNFFRATQICEVEGVWKNLRSKTNQSPVADSLWL